MKTFYIRSVSSSPNVRPLKRIWIYANINQESRNIQSTFIRTKTAAGYVSSDVINCKL